VHSLSAEAAGVFLTERILVTGAAGFVGHHLCSDLVQAGYQVHALSRLPMVSLSGLGVRVFVVGDIALVRDWTAACAGVDSVVHLSGRAHVLRESAANSSRHYHYNNVEATKCVAHGAIECGVRQFIFMSTVKVFGDGPFNEPLRPSHVPCPSDDYGRSKLEAEQWLFSQAKRGAIEATIVRPPLVYGPGVRGNFLRLMGWVSRGVPLPLARVANKRSLVSVWNLNDLIIRLIARRGAVAGVWHASDGEDCSTSELIEELAYQMGTRARLFAVSPKLLKMTLSLVGRRLEYDRLFGSLQVDVSDTIGKLAWHPPVSMREGLAQTVRWYLNRHDGGRT
jgi:nucleoside-diphosphate-sugar epimerase